MDNKLALIIVGEKDFNSEQFEAVKEAFQSESIDIKIANMYGATSESVAGDKIDADLSITQVQPDDYNIIVLIGGAGAEDYYCDDTVSQMLKDAYDMGIVIGALSNSTIALANAGLLKGVRVNADENSKDALVGKGAIFSESDPENDHDIVTSRGLKIQDFSKAIIDKIKSNE